MTPTKAPDRDDLSVGTCLVFSGPRAKAAGWNKQSQKRRGPYHIGHVILSVRSTSTASTCCQCPLSSCIGLGTCLSMFIIRGVIIMLSA